MLVINKVIIITGKGSCISAQVKFRTYVSNRMITNTVLVLVDTDCLHQYIGIYKLNSLHSLQYR